MAHDGRFELRSTGEKHAAPGAVDRIPPFNPRTGAHFWVLPVAYRILNPARWYDRSQPDESRLLDFENLALVSGVGCYHCEQPWSERIESRRCKGQP